VATAVYAGNTSDPRTVADQAKKMKERFGLERAVLVGTAAASPRHRSRCWGSIRAGLDRGLAQHGDPQPAGPEADPALAVRPAEPGGDRLARFSRGAADGCFNPLLAGERRRKRDELLSATEKLLEKIAKEVQRRTKTPLSKAQIGMKVGRNVNRYKMAKHFQVTIGDGSFGYQRRERRSSRRSRWMGSTWCAPASRPIVCRGGCGAGVQDLAHVERVFRCLKGIDLLVRPIYLRTEDHVKAHIFLCLLAYYVEWHMRRALANCSTPTRSWSSGAARVTRSCRPRLRSQPRRRRRST